LIITIPIKNIENVNSLPYTITDKIQEVSVKFMGLIPENLGCKKNIDDFNCRISKPGFHLKFVYKNLSNEERLWFSPVSLENVQIKTQNGNIWKYKNEDMTAVPITFFKYQVDPKEEFRIDKYRIRINPDETPKFVHMTIGDIKYIFNVEKSSTLTPFLRAS